MSPADGPTQADAALIVALAERGIPVTPRQLRRWRAAGLLPSPRRVALGQGRGRPSMNYPARAVDRAAWIYQLLHDGLTLRSVALELVWAEADDLPLPVARNALRSLIDDVERHRPRTADPGDAGNVLAHDKLLSAASTTTLGRRWIQRAGTYGARRNSAVETAFAAIASLMLGTIDHDEIETADAEALGVLAQVIGAPSDLLKDALPTMEAFSTPAILADLEIARSAELREATRLAKDYYLLIDSFAASEIARDGVPALIDPFDNSIEQRGVIVLLALSVRTRLDNIADAISNAAEELRKTGKLSIIEK